MLPHKLDNTDTSIPCLRSCLLLSCCVHDSSSENLLHRSFGNEIPCSRQTPAYLFGFAGKLVGCFRNEAKCLWRHQQSNNGPVWWRQLNFTRIGKSRLTRCHYYVYSIVIVDNTHLCHCIGYVLAWLFRNTSQRLTAIVQRTSRVLATASLACWIFFLIEARFSSSSLAIARTSCFSNVCTCFFRLLSCNKIQVVKKQDFEKRKK